MIQRIFTRSFLSIVLASVLASGIYAQTPNGTPRTYKKQTFTKTKANPESEKVDFEKAYKITNASERISALQAFMENYPESSEKTRASELLVSSRAEAADEKLRSGETAIGVELFKRAIADAPKPISDKLFNEIILQIPTNLFFRGQTAAALEAAVTIEEKAEGNAKQLLGLATFYLGTENALEAKRIAEKAIVLEPNLPAAHQTLGLANRLNFQMDAAASSYAKALELDPNSIVSKRSLAEMYRSLEKPNEAITLYREILVKDANDASAETGLILALFDADKKAEAETEMAKALEVNPGNLPLLVGVSYWYAARGQGAKSIELAEKAVAVEPRYTWARIALARGLLRENRPLEAERALLTARQYGNFPTLDYEIAAARMSAGFYREAAEELKKSFVVRDNVIETKLGGRVSAQGKSFIELLGPERRASIFQPLAADDAESAQKLKSLLEFSLNLDSSEARGTVIEPADEFIKGEDKMKLHRQIFVAGRLLERKIALPKILEITKSAVGAVDSSLEVATPAAAVLADELYESRTLAMTKGELVIVPEVSKQTLSSILRGRIEEITGWTLFQQDKPAEAVVRLKRAVSVLPEKSAWWRSSLWKLGTALESDGKSKEALASYVKSYTNGEQSLAKRIVIESIYQKVNGNLEGLDAQIGVNAVAAVNIASPVQADPPGTVAQTGRKQNSQTIPAAVPAATVRTPKLAPTTAPRFDPPAAVQSFPAPEVATQKEAIALPKTENTSIPDAEPQLKTKTKIEDKQTATIASAENSAKKPAETVKPLFEPIVITVPSAETEKPVTKAEQKEEESGKINENDSLPASPIRQRVISENNAETSAPPKTISQCQLKISQDIVSIRNNGGSLGILINLDGEGDLDGLKAASSSPNDVEAKLETEIVTSSQQAFFTIKSISVNKGEYKITFESGCGAKEILVTVR